MAAGDRIKAMNFEFPENIPVGVGILPAAWMKYRGELDAIVKRHPVIFGNASADRNYDEVGGTYVAGNHTDVWGCVWENVATGREAIVRHHPYPTRESVHALKPPEKDAGIPHGFMYLRLCDMRGFEEIMIDFAEEPPELQALIDIVLEYNMRQVGIMLQNRSSKPRGFFWFGDDLGTQHALPISPEKWRKYLKPCYMKLYKPVRAEGHYVYMHTDGHIFEIIPDLIECGVNVINPQVRANGLDNLARVCKGKVCVALDLDRQMFPFCNPADIDSHVREAVEMLGSPEGGLWLSAEIDDGVPLENVEAICVALEKYRGFYSR
jgi:hypothetical protein